VLVFINQGWALDLCIENKLNQHSVNHFNLWTCKMGKYFLLCSFACTCSQQWDVIYFSVVWV